jgi:ribonuclease R
MTTTTGTLVFHPKGFGFLRDQNQSSHFVPPPLLKSFYLGDLCQAEITEEADGRTRVTKLDLLERDRRTVFGQAQRKGRQGFFLDPDPEVANNPRKLLSNSFDIENGDWILADLSKDNKLRVRAIFYNDDKSPERDIARLTSRYDVRQDYSKDALAQLKKLPKRWTADMRKGRRDLRDLTTVTVDAPSTKDIDDAISVLPADAKGGIRLFVSIADATAYVPLDSPLDLEARDRATSVYMIGHVLPMFPRALSEDQFSLLPGKDRLALTAEMRLDIEGNMTSLDLYESIIRSDGRVSYQEADQYLRGIDTHKSPNVADAFKWFRTASARLSIQRRLRGGLENPHVEPKVELDEESGEPTYIVARRQNCAHQMIERFMVAANEAVASWFKDRGVDTLYRVHQSPKKERVLDLVRFARNFGLEPGIIDELTPIGLAACAAQVEGSPSGAAFFSVLMRCLGKAFYSPENEGHFGLASDQYLHFTSPIRRYSDMVVHRIIKSYLRGQREELTGDLMALSAHIAKRERAASSAERDHQKVVWARYMSTRIGEVYDGNITGVKSFGLFVQLNESRIQGLLPVEALSPRKTKVTFDETALALTVGRRSFEVGQPLRVKVESTDLELGRIEFKLVNRRKNKR